MLLDLKFIESTTRETLGKPMMVPKYNTAVIIFDGEGRWGAVGGR